MEELKNTIADCLQEGMISVAVDIPYKAAELVNLFHRFGKVDVEEHRENGTRIEGTIPTRLEPEFREHNIEGETGE